MRLVKHVIYISSITVIHSLCIQISKSHKRKDEQIGDFCDGTLFKDHPLYKKDPLALQIIAYYDDVEMCNPLGTHRGINKLG